MKLINYPAMASPESIKIIDNYIDAHLVEGSRIIDPFCGTGRLLFNPRKKGHFVTGVDCSPVAILTARVSHQVNNINQLEKELAAVVSKFKRLRRYFHASEDEKFWFSSQAFNDLRKILFSIEIESSTLYSRRFFWLALVDTVRVASYIRENEYKTHRMKLDQRNEYRPDALVIFESSCKKMIKRLFDNQGEKSGGYRLIQGDIGSMNIPKTKFDALITSPPYGDSISTVGYGQFARIPLIILSYSQCFNEEFDITTKKGSLDTFCLGGSNCKTSGEVSLPESVQYITKGPMRKFCVDYFQRLKLVTDALNERAMCSLILADRTYKKQKFPLIDSTVSYMEGMGFKLISRNDRYLSLKRLPRTMQHINQDKAATHVGMNYESVVIFQR